MQALSLRYARLFFSLSRERKRAGLARVLLLNVKDQSLKIVGALMEVPEPLVSISLVMENRHYENPVDILTTVSSVF